MGEKKGGNGGGKEEDEKRVRKESWDCYESKKCSTAQLEKDWKRLQGQNGWRRGRRRIAYSGGRWVRWGSHILKLVSERFSFINVQRREALIRYTSCLFYCLQTWIENILWMKNYFPGYSWTPSSILKFSAEVHMGFGTLAARSTILIKTFLTLPSTTLFPRLFPLVRGEGDKSQRNCSAGFS